MSSVCALVAEGSPKVRSWHGVEVVVHGALLSTDRRLLLLLIYFILAAALSSIIVDPEM